MGSNHNFRFNPRLYENHLSAFGRKVLNGLIHKWKSDQNHVQKSYQERFPPSTQQRRDLTFRDVRSYKSLPPTVCNETVNVYQEEKSFDFNLIDRNLPPVSTSLQLVQTIDTPDQSTINDNTNISNMISSGDLINPIIHENIVNDLRTPFSNITEPDSSENNERIDPKHTKDIDWDNMFDAELFTAAAVTNAERVLNQTENPVKNNLSMEFLREKSMKSNKSKAVEVEYKQSKNDSKRKNQSITDAIPKKVKKVTDKTKISFRKQKYTKAVKNWLDDVDPNYLVEKHESSNKDIEQNKTIERDEVIIEKLKGKTNKKVVQAQLANKDGVMKFNKPKTEKIHEQERDKTDGSVKIADKKVVEKNSKTKKDDKKNNKNKPKFVAPIKSQIPVKDVQFTVITVDENNINEYIHTIRRTENKDLVIVLIYSNGFSQLNNQHTEDTCHPEGILISIDDEFYYFKGSHQNNSEILRTLLYKNKIVCYEGKSLLIYFKSTLDIDIHNIYVMDTKIGGSLLDPDSPPENFSELQELLTFTPHFTIATDCILQKSAWYATLLKECGAKLTSLLTEEQLWRVFMEIEMKLLPIIAEMEIRGVTVDLQKLKAMEDILLTKMKSRELACHKAAGKTFQINSPVQVRALIYDELQLDTKCNVTIRETLSKGAKSTSESMLRSLVSVHPLPKLILEYRHLHKAHATFLTGIAQHVKDGIVRPTWVQTAAATGRIASNNPNLQAIPKAPFSLVLFPEDGDTDERVLSIRSVYTARAGYTLLAADFKHVECRVFAHLAADSALLAMLRGRRDLFRALAHKWLNKPEADVTAEDRERTKRIVYASLYGAGCRKLMDILDVSYDQALSVIASFNRTFPSLKSFGRSVVSRCERGGGRLASLCGRARRFRNITSTDFALRSQAERQAVNFVIQGSAADLCKMAMVLTTEQLRNHSPPMDGCLLLQIHDELVWEIKDQHLETAAVIIRRAMEGCGYQSGMSVTLPVSVSAGKNWGEMAEYLTDISDRR